ncbi:cytidylate kinase family protein [Candidatus Woesearchaeota archaeon]|nr:cytidylate kinase family protein [Candidatus Woesearchaeota archaeon]
MIITVSGSAGSGKSTVAQILAKKLKYRHYSVGDFMRVIAKKRKKTLLELSKDAESDETIDEELDDMQISLGRQDNIVLDSRLGWHFIPRSFKVFLDVDKNTAAQRIFKAKRHLENENQSLKATLENINKRKKSELHRYKKYYNLNPYDKKHYDLVIDTTGQTAEETAFAIIKAISNQ